jgi:N-methylhydantoinase A
VETKASVRIGLDTGGTFTDVVAFDPARGTVTAAKMPSDRDLSEGLEACELLGPGAAALVGGTTRVTNAILEGRLARTALVTTAGFGDVLAIGRQARDHLYDLRRPARVPPPVPRELCFEVAERLDATGTPLVALTREEVGRIVGAVKQAGVEAVAICLLHAYANPRHEAELATAFAGLGAISVSHWVSRERREYERASTTALNAAVMPEIDRYLSEQLGAAASTLPGASAYVVHSSGGMMTAERTRLVPLATVMSGPAAGVAASARLARRLEVPRAVSLDMGGTSTDVCLLLDGVPATARDRTLGGHAIRLPAVAVESIGAGGGSIAATDDLGALRVGPRSAGAEPGPAAYGRGGREATVTDANVVLGTAGGWSGGLALEEEPAREACARLGSRLDLHTVEAARAVLEVAHAQMERALRLVTVRRGHDLRESTLVAYGGAGPMHAGAVALAAGIPRVLVPALSSTFSALGCCLSELAVEDVRTCLAELTDSEWPRINAELDQLVSEMARDLGDGVGDGRLRAVQALELRYRGQNDALEVTLEGVGSVQALRSAFHERHRREFGYATEELVEVTAVRARLWLDEGTSWAAPEGRAGESRLGEAVLRLADGERGAPVLHRGALEPGRRIPGPALLADELSTVVVWPGLAARTDEDANIWLEVGA